MSAECEFDYQIIPAEPVILENGTVTVLHPPTEIGDFLPSDLADLTEIDPRLTLDIVYATSDNFAREQVYNLAKAFMQRPAAEALKRVHDKLIPKGFGLLIYDGYRPWFVTKKFWDITPEIHKEFVADPATGSRHNRGCAVDLSLIDLSTGNPVEMPSGYDEFTERAYPSYTGGSEKSRFHRDLLREAMEAEGFTVMQSEWWHFDYPNWKRYKIHNEAFEDLVIGSTR